MRRETGAILTMPPSRRVRLPHLMEPAQQAERLRRLRVIAGRKRNPNKKPLTTTAMARILGIGQQQYSAYETRGDNPSSQVLAALKDEFGVTADWVLLGDTDGMDHPLLQELESVTRDELRATMKSRD